MSKLKKKICFIGNERNLFLKNISHIFDQHELVYLHEDKINDLNTFNKFRISNNIDLFFFQNPYGNTNKLKIYRYIRQKGTLHYIASDRGALPNSWFFDPNGFNADSFSYTPDNWDHPLGSKKKERIEDYIKIQAQTDASLEKQGSMVGGDALRKKLNITENKKVLFVPLQRPSDTVIKYFSGHVNDMDDFINQIVEAQKRLLDTWVVLVKKHPLEIEKPSSDQLRYVDDSTHFKDLLQLCDAVALINSGVGVTAMMYQIPVYYFGDAFYGHPEINQQISSAAELVDHLQTGKFAVNAKKVQRFISYLIEDFYSFGTFHTEERTERDGSKRTITTKIDFNQIKNIPSCSEFEVLIVTDVKFWLNSVGNQARIYQLILALQKEARIAIFFIGSVLKGERLKLKQSSLDIYVTFADDIPELDQMIDIDLSPNNITLKKYYNISIVKKFCYFNEKISYKVAIIEYIKFDYLFNILDPKSHRMIDTHDLFFQRTASYRQNNDVNFIEILEHEELDILKKYDSVLLIQKNEKKYLDAEINEEKNLLIPHCAPITCTFSKAANDLNIGFIASSANIPHFDWFMMNIWRYFEFIDGIFLNIYGNICNSSVAKKYKNTKNLFLKGKVPSIGQAYRHINVAINPIQYGSGLKIKNVESLAHGIPLITTDTGMQGMEEVADDAFLLANTIDEWIDAILMCKLSPTLREMLSQRGLKYCKENFSEKVYDPLINLIRTVEYKSEIQ